MLYFTTEALIRMLLFAAILNLAFLWPALWYLWRALWKADKVLTHIDIQYQVERSMRQWRVQQRAKEHQEQTSQAQ